MSDEATVGKERGQQEIECPHCHQKFWHRIGGVVKDATKDIEDFVKRTTAPEK